MYGETETSGHPGHVGDLDDEELREIKREIIESRGLVIKTNNLTNALSADIKSIAKRQQSYERRISWNSATAYVVFVVVVFESEEKARERENDPRRQEPLQSIRAAMGDVLNGPPEFFDCDVLLRH